MNLYYAIIGDALHSVRKTDNKYRWKSLVLLFFSAFLMLNVFALSFAIDIFIKYDIFNFIDKIVQCLPPVLSGKYSFAIILYTLCICIIYFSIFYKAKYIYIYRNYKHKKGKLLIIYLIVSGVLTFGIALLRNYLKWGVVFKVAASISSDVWYMTYI